MNTHTGTRCLLRNVLRQETVLLTFCGVWIHGWWASACRGSWGRKARRGEQEPSSPHQRRTLVSGRLTSYLSLSLPSLGALMGQGRASGPSWGMHWIALPFWRRDGGRRWQGYAWWWKTAVIKRHSVCSRNEYLCSLAGKSPVCQGSSWENIKSKGLMQSRILPNVPRFSSSWVYPDPFLYLPWLQDSNVEHPYRRWKRVEMPSTISSSLVFIAFVSPALRSAGTSTEHLR